MNCNGFLIHSKLIHNSLKIICIHYFTTAVAQHYDTDVHKVYVIRGNSAILKCEVPSYIADFVSVISWQTDQDETFYPDDKYGWFKIYMKKHDKETTFIVPLPFPIPKVFDQYRVVLFRFLCCQHFLNVE